MSESRSTGVGGRGKLAHRLVPMTGRNPQEIGRVATPLELLFDLTFVVAVGTAALHYAELLADGHPAQAAGAFLLAMFAICVAWIGFSWFASAFGTDDWLYRALTMVQMIGVVVFELGIPAMFHSVEEGDHLEMRVMVLGYIVMRVAVVLQWGRVSWESPSFRKVARANILWTLIAQVGWTVVAFADLPLPAAVISFAVLGTLDVLQIHCARVTRQSHRPVL
ncbi:low temperature requirement protein A, partial [Streptomyces sp. NPDC003832]